MCNFIIIQEHGLVYMKMIISKSKKEAEIHIESFCPFSHRVLCKKKVEQLLSTSWKVLRKNAWDKTSFQLCCFCHIIFYKQESK